VYRVFQSDKDAYITNKIISPTLRALDTNTGQAGTVDLFKLYDENSIVGETNPIELSRGLIHFDISNLISTLALGEFDPASPNFKCRLYMHDVYGGQTTPSNFSLVVYPLSKSFDEGVGRDIIRFEDIDVVNFITASTSLSATLWSSQGAAAGGTLGSPNLDYFTLGNLNDGLGTISLAATQSFETGEEDLDVDVTKIVSGVLSGQLPDAGFRISFIAAQEEDAKTRFVKRFASRNTTNTSKRPELIVTYDDTISDNTQIFEFNTSGSIFLNSFTRSSPSNLLSGSSLTALTGQDCIKVKLISGSLSRSFNASQHKIGNTYITGIYSASFLINSYDSDIFPYMTGNNYPSLNFGVKWLSNDQTVQFATGSLTVTPRNTTYFTQSPERYFINIVNMRSFYKFDEKFRFKIFIEDFNREIQYVKTPLENTGIIVEKCFYRVRDFESGDVIIPYHDPGTKTSNDATTHYFDFYMSSLPRGRTYTFDFKIVNKGQEVAINDVAAKFRVE
jgi:hypothetical protein